jgi:DNA-binding transcriptional ArsR family regulator
LPDVHHDELSARERAVMFALLSAARKLSNAELQELIGARLVGKERRKLNELKLVESERRGRWFVHELSEAGLRWCTEELAAGQEGRPTSLERSLYLVLGMFERYMTAARLSLADVASLDLKVRPAGRHKRNDTAEGDGGPSARVNLIPQPGHQALTAAGRESALGAGGEQRHLISID